jgi:large subunit ribosomal protein L18
MKSKLVKRQTIKFRIRKDVSGTPDKPRLSVYRSNKDIYCQLIDDVNGVTLIGASSKEITKEGNKVDQSAKVGELIADKAKTINISSVKFDRNGYLYHGRVKSLADGARKGGLKF